MLMADFKRVLSDLNGERGRIQRELQQIDEVISALGGLSGRNGATRGRPLVSANGRKGRRRMSAAGRRRIAAAQRARWAKIRAQKKAKAAK
jgi:hypothetical protein